MGKRLKQKKKEKKPFKLFQRMNKHHEFFIEESSNGRHFQFPIRFFSNWVHLSFVRTFEDCGLKCSSIFIYGDYKEINILKGKIYWDESYEILVSHQDVKGNKPIVNFEKEIVKQYAWDKDF